jgi:hypothetical protein
MKVEKPITLRTYELEWLIPYIKSHTTLTGLIDELFGNDCPFYVRNVKRYLSYVVGITDKNIDHPRMMKAIAVLQKRKESSAKQWEQILEGKGIGGQRAGIISRQLGRNGVVNESALTYYLSESNKKYLRKIGPDSISLLKEIYLSPHSKQKEKSDHEILISMSFRQTIKVNGTLTINGAIDLVKRMLETGEITIDFTKPDNVSVRKVQNERTLPS